MMVLMPVSDIKNLVEPSPNSLWRARDGRVMRFLHWLPDRANRTALMEVLSPGPRMRRQSEQSHDGFGTFLQPEEENG